MEQEYNTIHRRALDILNTFQNMVDAPQHAKAIHLREEFQRLIVDIRNKKHPRSLEDRIRGIQNFLLDVRDRLPELMRVDESVRLHKLCEDFRRGLRKFSNYQS